MTNKLKWLIIITAFILLLSLIIYCSIIEDRIIKKAEGSLAEDPACDCKIKRRVSHSPRQQAGDNMQEVQDGIGCLIIKKAVGQPAGRKVEFLSHNTANILEPPVIIRKVSIYHATQRQTDSTPLITADNTRIYNPRKQRIIALSRDLLERFKGRVSNWKGGFKYGDRVRISGCGKYDGVWVVRDCMANRRWNRRLGGWEYIRIRADLLVSRSVRGGRWFKVEMRKDG